MDFWRNVFGKKQIHLAIAGGISLFLFAVLTIIAGVIGTSMPSQLMVERWGSDEPRYAQVSCFFSELAEFSVEKVKGLEYAIDTKLKEDSITLSEDKANARLWIDAYSAGGEVTLTTKDNKFSAKAIGIGGDYFLFHPLKLLDGAYFAGSDLMLDHIIIDTDTAWALFGSNDVVGQVVEISGIRHIVSGVIQRDNGRMNNLAGNDVPVIYLSYDSLEKNGTITYLNTYEALMPNPITGYASGILKEKAAVSEDKFEVVENTNRFRWTSLFDNILGMGTRSMNSKSVIYPYWENEARGYEDILAFLLIFRILLILFPAGLFCLLLRRMWKNRTFHRKDIKNFIEKKIEEMREKKKVKRRNEQDEEME